MPAGAPQPLCQPHAALWLKYLAAVPKADLTRWIAHGGPFPPNFDAVLAAAKPSKAAAAANARRADGQPPKRRGRPPRAAVPSADAAPGGALVAGDGQLLDLLLDNVLATTDWSAIAPEKKKRLVRELLEVGES